MLSLLHFFLSLFTAHTIGHHFTAHIILDIMFLVFFPSLEFIGNEGVAILLGGTCSRVACHYSNHYSSHHSSHMTRLISICGRYSCTPFDPCVLPHRCELELVRVTPCASARDCMSPTALPVLSLLVFRFEYLC